MIHDKYDAVIGLEVHAQLLTQSKLFCGDSAAFGAAPNTQISPISLAHPGTLPMMNKKAIEFAATLGLALNCTIVKENYFARKNYFYPDLPKGYQVSQHTTPICINGEVPIKINGIEKNIILNRIHLEEDAGKSIHDNDEFFTSIDLNRAGVPLLEIVTEPCLTSADDAFAYLTELRKIVRWTGVCDGNMEEGSMRCDANISIKPKGATVLGTKVEVKNLNSIRNVKKAIEVELLRLIDLEENGKTIIQETRGYNADNNTTYSMRTKEAADDYRYFPEPDLTPFFITDEYLQEIKNNMPVLPAVQQNQLMQQYSLSEYDAAQICSDKEMVHYFIETIKHTNNYKAVVNWMQGPIKSYLNDAGIEINNFNILPKKLADIITLIDEGKINFTNASGKIFSTLITTPTKSPIEIATELNLLQETDNNAIEQWVQQTIATMPDKVVEYKKGKKGLIGLFAGEVKKISKGKADMQQATALLQQKLND